MSRALPFAIHLFHHIKRIDFICFYMVDNISFIIKFPYIFPISRSSLLYSDSFPHVRYQSNSRWQIHAKKFRIKPFHGIQHQFL